MNREQLAKRIAEVALLRGEFTICSGRKSNYYLDKYHPRSVKNRRRGKKQFLISDAQPIYRKKLVPPQIGV
jgi:orotate phosphoribosyltransferase